MNPVRNLKKGLILGAVAVLVIVALGFLIKGNGFFTASRATKPANRPMETSRGATITVDYTNQGYSPAVARLHTGDTVIFVNGSTHPMWIASDPHPVHSAYPEFDAKRSYAPGESYSFTFEKAGSWGYHNHLQPTDAGKVVIEKP